MLLLLLLLSRFSRVQLCAIPETAAHQAPPSLGFSRQEHWSGLPFPSPMHEVKSENEVAQSCPTLSDPMDCSLPSSSVYGIFQARVLEWGCHRLLRLTAYWTSITVLSYWDAEKSFWFQPLNWSLNLEQTEIEHPARELRECCGQSFWQPLKTLILSGFTEQNQKAKIMSFSS